MNPALADALGRGYIVEHCVQALRDEAEARSYRAYVTDALKLLTENTAGRGPGRCLTRRWADALRPDDGQTGDEIAAGVIRRAGLRFTEGPSGDQKTF